MINYSALAIIFILLLFSGMLIFMHLGRRVAIWQRTRGTVTDTPGFRIAEGAIFTLLGLLVAFTFNSSAGKFDARRQIIIQEANAISTAYLRLSLLPTAKNRELKNLFQDYLTSRLETYKRLPNIQDALDEVTHSQQIQKNIWNLATSNCLQESSPASCMLLLPALNEMFDLENTRVSMTKIHPPLFIFVLLVCLVLLNSVLAGYSISHNKLLSSLHVISYAVVISLTVYAIIDMEYPRLGIIQITDFDQVLAEVRNGFN